MIPLPWLLVGVGLLLAITNAISFIKGGEARQNAMLAAAAQASDQAVRRFNAFQREDLEAARLAAERAGRARLAAANTRHQFELEAARGLLLNAQNQPLPSADAPRLSAAAVGLFNAAIDAYNAAAQPTGGSRDAVPPDGAPRPSQPGSGGRAAATAGLDLRRSDVLRADAPRERRMAAAAD